MNMQPSEGALGRQVAVVRNRRGTNAKRLLTVVASLVGLSPFMSAQVFNDSGFGTELVATIPAFSGVGLAWAPDGRLFVWQKNGIVRIVKNGVLLPTPFIDLSSQVNTYDDRGMWGLAFHPDFVNNGYVYLSFVYENAGNPNDSNPKTSRLIRVTANPSNRDVALANSQVIILSNLPADSGSHDIGTIRFAPDGRMFVGNGDGADAGFVDPNSLRAQDLSSFAGKILRINPDGTAPGDNPFDDGTDSIRSKVWCYGLRNPYRFSLHPGTGLPYMGDVGWNTWEEINKGIPGANYGWPFYEGNDPQPGYQGAFGPGPSPSSVTAPIFTYNHTLGSAVILGPFYTGTQYPAVYQGNLFFGDYSGNWIRRVVFDASGTPVSFPYFATNVPAPVSIELGPDGLLYYISFTTGEIRRIRFNGPVAVASVTPSYGYSPLTVSFSSDGSTDHGGGSLSYSWNFGDGTTSSVPNPSHTYVASSPTTFTATLTVRNSTNLTSSATTKVTVGSMPPTPTITAPVNGTGVMPGQTVTYQGSATDPDDGPLPPSSLNWTILLHHNTHVHTFVGGTGSQGSFIVENHGSIGSFNYEVILTATDSSGLSTSTSVSVPILVDTAPPSAPTGLTAIAAGGNRVNLSWAAATDNAGVDRYLIERQGGGSATFVQIAEVTGTAYSDLGLAPTTTYSYRVRAVDASGNLGLYSAVASATTTQSTSAPGLVAAYSFDEGTGITVADSSGNGNNGTVQGATWTTQGKYNNALSFNGSSNLVVINSTPSLNISSAMTLEAWIYPTASQSGWRTIMQRQVDAYFLNASNSSGSLIPAGGGMLGGSVSYITGSTANPVNTWTHVALTYDGAMLRLYVNGNVAGSAPASGPIETNSNPLRIGGNVPYGEYFQGRIDEVRVYNRALSQAELQTDMNTAIAGSTANTPPTISSMANQTTQVNTSTGPIGFTVGDAETATGNLTLSGSSSNSTLVPNANIVFGGSGANRTVTVTPATGQTGTATITVTVNDGSATASSSFLLTVNGSTPNTPPTISSIPNQATAVNTVVGPIGFTVGDAETAPANLSVTGTSSNTTLVPNTNIVFGGSGTNRTITITPATGQTGTTTITVTVSDGTATAGTSFLLNVTGTPPNTPPTISTIANQTTQVNTSTGPISFTVGDVETPATSLTLIGTSSNATLVPNGNIVFGGSGANRTVTVTPASAQTGTSTITVTVNDGSATASTSFLLTVNGSGPTGLVAAYSFDEGSGTTVADASGNGNTGTIQGATWSAQGRYGSALSFNGSSNLVVINGSPSLNLSAAMTLEAWIYPTASQSGWRTIIQRQTDAYFLNASNDSGPLRPAGGGMLGGTVYYISGPTANPVNTWRHVALTYDGTILRLYVDGNQAASAQVSGGIETNSNPLRIGGNVPYGEYFQGRIDEVRIYNRAVSQAELQTDMNTPVGGSASNTPPTISSINNQTTQLNTAVGPINFTVGDGETAAGSLTLSGSSSNPTLVPNANIVFGGSGANRTVSVTPATGQTGTTTIIVTVSDGTATATSSFLLTVSGSLPNSPPTISSIANQTTPLNTVSEPISFTVGDAETAAANLTVSGSSSNTILVPNANIVFGGSGANRTVTITPATGQTGSATITLTVSDGAATVSTSFLLSVSGTPSNTPPTISTIGNQTTQLNTTVGPISFTVGDAETAAGNLTVSASSSNTTLVPSANIFFGGSGANRTITITPATGQAGTATITVTVSDGTATTNGSFLLTINGSAASGLVAAYSFNAGSGTTVADSSGNGNTGTIQGATWTTQGKFGSALNFNGTSNFVIINASPSLNVSSAMTLEAWIYPTASQSGWRTILQRQVDAYFLNASNSSGARRPAGGGTFGGRVYYISGPTANPLNTWTHVALTYDGAMQRLYVNGTQVASGAASGSIETNSNSLRIGGNVPYGEYFQGRIDEVRIYNRALSQAELQTDMNAAITP